MLQIRGSAGGTTLTGTLYEEDDTPPSFRGAPDESAPYVWVCDEFYQVDSGGQLQRIGERELNVAFETPIPRGFEARERAIDAAKAHVRTQFARLGVPEAEVDVEVVETTVAGDVADTREALVRDEDAVTERDADER